MKIIITGFMGFIGSHVTRYLLNKYPDYTFYGIDKMTYAAILDNIKDFCKYPNFKFMKEDICNISSLNCHKELKSYDMLINFAADSFVGKSIVNADDFIYNDIVGVHELLKFCLQNNIKYYQFSTDEIMGSIAKGKFSEEDVPNPHNPYSASKMAAENLTRSFWYTYKHPVLITRCCNVYGPYQHPEKLIPVVITNLLRGKKANVHGSGKHVREWIHISDVCTAVDFLVHNAKFEGDIYNMGSNIEKTNLEIITQIVKTLNKSTSTIQFVKNRRGNDERYSLDTKKINLLGWKAKKKFNIGLKETITWYKENSWWWKKLVNNNE